MPGQTLCAVVAPDFRLRVKLRRTAEALAEAVSPAAAGATEVARYVGCLGRDRNPERGTRHPEPSAQHPDRIHVFRLVLRSFIYYWRTNLAVVAGVATSVSVLAGALAVGESVRGSLRDLVLARLGRTELVVSAPIFFRDALAPALAEATGRPTSPLIAVEGVVTHEPSGRRAARVLVYGVDERFWQFHGRGAPAALDGRSVVASEAVIRDLAAAPGDALLLRVERPSSVPLESLHGRKENVGRTIRLSLAATQDAANLGEFSLRPQQGDVRAVFVALERLQRDLDRPGRVNTILVGASESAMAEPDSVDALEAGLRTRVGLDDLGVTLRSVGPPGFRAMALESEGGLLEAPLAEAGLAAARAMGVDAAPVFTYLVNAIRAGDREIPYSLVTAIDLGRITAAGSPASSGDQPPIVLNEWAARDLGIGTADTRSVEIEYYRWLSEGRLVTERATFRLAGIVPMTGLAADRDLAPRYPGISDTDSLAEWDPPFLLDLRRVRPIDEDYWDRHRATPKAFVPLEVGQRLWESRWGRLTSLRVPLPFGRPEDAAIAEYGDRLLSLIDPVGLGVTVFPARALALAASRGATDFGEYFLYFSAFLVAAALLLAALLFRLGVEQRLRQIGILVACGFPPTAVRRLFVLEGGLLAALGGFVGVAGAALYAGAILAGLRTWWIGAVGTTRITLHLSPLSLALGVAGGVLAALVAVAWTLRAVARQSPRALLAESPGTWGVPFASRAPERVSEPTWGPPSGGPKASSSRPPQVARPALGLSWALAVVAVVIVGASSVGIVGQTAGFFGAGLALLIAGLMAFSRVVRARGRHAVVAGHGWWPLVRLGARSASYRPGRSVLCAALSAAATCIIGAGDAFRRDAAASLDPRSGTGGYALAAEALLPVVQDPNAPEGREALNLAGSPADTALLREVRLESFRLRTGDDASCLNLYQPRNPRILSASDAFVGASRFRFRRSLAETPEERANPWRLLHRDLPDGAVPVIADANSMQYVLHVGVGDDLVLPAGAGRSVRLRFVAALDDSVFQSELLMGERHFVRVFPDEQGYRFFLVQAPADRVVEVATRLEERLSDFGLDVVSTIDRLAAFHRVENAYLSTFQALGGLGLVLGTLGLATVLARNVIEQRRELALLRAVGYQSSHLSLVIVAEHAFLLAVGLLVGALSAVVAIAPAVLERGGRLPGVALGALLVAVVASALLSSFLATRVAVREPLLAALRAE
mgnify:CR=1 FL=1